MAKKQMSKAGIKNVRANGAQGAQAAGKAVKADQAAKAAVHVDANKVKAGTGANKAAINPGKVMTSTY